MSKREFGNLGGISVPHFFYGTAWKEDRTAALTEAALHAGFLAIDTANQRKHYFEEAVGQGLQAFLARGTRARSELFLQTKFTYARGQDHRKPYDEKAAYGIQVEQSFASSLTHLGVIYLDSYLLHGPFGQGFGREDREVWRAMERLQKSGKVKFLGLSNMNPAQIRELHDFAEVKPSFAQIRTYAARSWEKETRALCAEKGILFQAFSLLTANAEQLDSELVAKLAKKYKKENTQIIFRFAQQLGMIPLTGTSSEAHMKLDLEAESFDLTAAEIAAIESL